MNMQRGVQECVQHATAKQRHADQLAQWIVPLGAHRILLRRAR